LLRVDALRGEKDNPFDRVGTEESMIRALVAPRRYVQGAGVLSQAGN